MTRDRKAEKPRSRAKVKRPVVRKIDPPVLAASRWAVAWNVNDDVQKIAEPVFDRWLWLVPTWVHSMDVQFAPNIDGKVRMRIISSPQYRQAAIDIGPGFIGDTRQGRDEAWIHELMHLNIAPIQRCFEILIDAIKPEIDKTAHRVLSETYDDALEASVVDLTNAMHKLAANGTLSSMVKRSRRA